MDPLEEQLRRSLADPRHVLRSPGDPVPRVVAGVRRRRRRRVALAGGGTLAAFAAVALGVSLLTGSQDSGLQTANPPPASPTVSTTPTAGPSGTPAPQVVPPVASRSATAGAAQSGGPVPPGFTVVDLSYVSATRGWALGTAPCSHAPCTSLLRTGDGGRTWSGGPAPVAYLPSDGADCSVVPCVGHLRFADATHGYAYGAGALFTTSDAGNSWARQTGPYVEQLEAAGGDVLRVVRTTAGCPPGCRYTVERAPVGSASWQALATPSLQGNSSLLLRHGSDAYLLVFGNPAGGAGSAHAQVAVTHDRGTTWALRPDPCSPAASNDPRESDATDGSVGPDGSLVVLCRARAGGAGSVVVSTDSARSFGAAAALPTGDLPSLVATSGTRLVVAVTRGATLVLLASDDGGRSWASVASTTAPARSPMSGNGLLGFTDARAGSWAPAGSRSIWRSTDGGATWAAFPYGRG